MSDRYVSEPKTPPEELKIPEEFHDEYLSLDVEYNEETGSSGDGFYGFYFEVPEEASEEILNVMNWSKGDTIRLSCNAFDSPDPEEYEPE